MARIIADPGSTHLGDLDRCERLVDIAIDAGCWAIKWQTWQQHVPMGENVWLPWSYIPLLQEYAGNRIKMFASFFDEESMKMCATYFDTAKIAYPVRNERWWRDNTERFSTLFISYGYIDSGYANPDIPTIRRLLCIPEYPVHYQMRWFDGIFDRFDGFSDHTLGTGDSECAISCGAKYLEKHIRVGDEFDFNCPDGRFAITPKELKTLCEFCDGTQKVSRN